MSAAESIDPNIQIRLIIRKGPHAGQSFSFAKSQVTIGRNPENDIILMNDPKISRNHARIEITGQDIEIVNLSQKNTLIVNGESVQKWKLANDVVFIVGESEFQIQFDLGQSVVPVRPQLHVAAVNSNPAAPPVPAAKPSRRDPGLPQVHQEGAMAHPSKPPPNPFEMSRQKAKVNEPEKIWNNPRFRLYGIVGLVVVALLVFVLSPTQKGKTSPRRSTLKYEDEVAIKLNSNAEKESKARLDELRKQKNSPTTQRAQENFIKGMRDFQLGNYSRAQDFFQVVLNLQPDHALARRHLYLAKVRFDEVLKAKLVLGESYYQKHNFRMCEAMFQQVKDMLEGKSNDRNLQLAQSMSEKCRLAAEGVR